TLGGLCDITVTLKKTSHNSRCRRPAARRAARACVTIAPLRPRRWARLPHFFMQNGTLLAAVDLGSNSFRLEIGRYQAGHIERVEYLKETVRQGAGLDEDKNLNLAAMERGWECLARFGERLQGFKKQQVRAVATQTLREARNRDEFLQRAQQMLGFAIEVVPGHEEARLIYQG